MSQTHLLGETSSLLVPALGERTCALSIHQSEFCSSRTPMSKCIFYSRERVLQLTPTSRDESPHAPRRRRSVHSRRCGPDPQLVSTCSQQQCDGEPDGRELFIMSRRKLPYNHSGLFPLSSMAHACTGSRTGKALAQVPASKYL